MTKGKLKYLILVFSGLLIGLDQLFKWLAQAYLSNLPELTLPVIPDVFHLTYLENRGAAFGILDGKAVFLIVLTGIILAALIWLLLVNRIKKPFLMWSVGLIIGGGIGNLIDRVFRHYVIDYLDFRIIQFAVFNFADCCVVIGTVCIMVYLLFFEHRTDKADTETAKDSGGSSNG